MSLPAALWASVSASVHRDIALEESAAHFSVKGHIVDILGFVDPWVPVTAI